MQEEAENLAARFQGVVRRHFAQAFQVPGGEAMIYQHIKGIRPISLDAAKAYARGFKCTLAEISPRLARDIAGAAEYSEVNVGIASPPPPQYGPPWPFADISVERWNLLSEKQRSAIEEWVDDQITKYTGQPAGGKRHGSSAA